MDVAKCLDKRTIDKHINVIKESIHIRMFHDRFISEIPYSTIRSYPTLLSFWQEAISFRLIHRILHPTVFHPNPFSYTYIHISSIDISRLRQSPRLWVVGIRDTDGYIRQNIWMYEARGRQLTSPELYQVIS